MTKEAVLLIIIVLLGFILLGITWELIVAFVRSRFGDKPRKRGKR